MFISFLAPSPSSSLLLAPSLTPCTPFLLPPLKIFFLFANLHFSNISSVNTFCLCHNQESVCRASTQPPAKLDKQRHAQHKPNENFRLHCPGLFGQEGVTSGKLWAEAQPLAAAMCPGAQGQHLCLAKVELFPPLHPHPRHHFSHEELSEQNRRWPTLPQHHFLEPWCVFTSLIHLLSKRLRIRLSNRGVRPSESGQTLRR